MFIVNLTCQSALWPACAQPRFDETDVGRNALRYRYRRWRAASLGGTNRGRELQAKRGNLFFPISTLATFCKHKNAEFRPRLSARVLSLRHQPGLPLLPGGSQWPLSALEWDPLPPSWPGSRSPSDLPVSESNPLILQCTFSVGLSTGSRLSSDFSVS